MLWQRTVKKDGSEKWIAVGPDWKPIADENGFYWTRYETREGAPIYKSKKKNQPDKSFQPEELPDGVDRNTPEGFISTFLLSDEARSDWAFLDRWKGRKYATITHAGCGEGDWPEVSSTIPITCPNCGVLPKDANLYARWQTTSKQDGEGVKVCVYEAWLNGDRSYYIAGKVPPVKTKSRTWPVFLFLFLVLVIAGVFLYSLPR